MPLLFTVVPYLICGGVLWFIVHQFAPIGAMISLWEVIGVIFVLGIAQRLWQSTPGQLTWLADTAVHFAVLVLLLLGIVRLTFINSVKAAAVYFAIFIGLNTVMGMWAGK